jgi:hypothetical protein
MSITKKKVVDRPTTTPGREVGKRERPAEGKSKPGRYRASAARPSDPYCHVLKGRSPYRSAVCGVSYDPPLPIEHTHAEPPCPNGHPACPDCRRSLGLE